MTLMTLKTLFSHAWILLSLRFVMEDCEVSRRKSLVVLLGQLLLANHSFDEATHSRKVWHDRKYYKKSLKYKITIISFSQPNLQEDVCMHAPICNALSLCQVENEINARTKA